MEDVRHLLLFLKHVKTTHKKNPACPLNTVHQNVVLRVFVLMTISDDMPFTTDQTFMGSRCNMHPVWTKSVNNMSFLTSRKKVGKISLLQKIFLVRASGKPNYLEARVPVPTHWDHYLLDSLLEDYEDKLVVDFLRYGWPMSRSILPLTNGSAKVNHKGA